jgi:hypothetical protein
VQQSVSRRMVSRVEISQYAPPPGATGHGFHAGAVTDDFFLFVQHKNSPFVPPQKIPFPAASWRDLARQTAD